MLYIILPLYWKEVGLSSLFEVGILLSINRFIRLPLNPLATWLFGRIGLRNGILIAVVLAGITTLAYGQLEGFWLWFLLRCIWGIAWTLLRLGGFFMIIELSSSDQRGYFMGLYNGWYRIGSLVGMLGGGLLIGWLGLSFVTILFSCLAFSAIPFVVRFLDPAPIEVVPKGQSVLSMITAIRKEDKKIGMTLLSGLLIAMIYQGMFTATLSHLIQVYLSPDYLIWGVTFGAAAVAGSIQALRWGWEPWIAPWIGKKSDTNNRRRPLFIASLLAGSFLFFLVPSGIPGVLWVIVLIGIQLTATLLTTLADTIASASASGSFRMLIMAAYSFMLDFGAAIGPFIGYLMEVSTLSYGAAIILLGLAVSWSMNK